MNEERTGREGYKRPCLIAEAGCNHIGDLNTAKQLIMTAALYCKADVIKFQKRCIRELLTPAQYNAPHPNPVNSYGKNYGAHREFLEFSAKQHAELKKCCEAFGIVYSCSVWDLTSAKEIAALNPRMIKIPSASNTNADMLTWLCDNYEGKLHLSLGMTTRKEEAAILDLLESKGRLADVVLYVCTAGYPVPHQDICLLELKRVRESYGESVMEIAFSGHHLGIAVDIAAYALGASTIERHYTLDRTRKGTDHAASLEPYDMMQLKRDLENTYQALTYKRTEILPIEQVQRDKLKYRKQDAL